MFNTLQKIAEEKALRDLQGDWYQGAQTYLDCLIDEVDEVKHEIKFNRQCYLEDELSDLLWNIVCILEHLELSGDIDKASVMIRAVKKYKERVTERCADETWDSVKEKQKENLRKEYLINT